MSTSKSGSRVSVSVRKQIEKLTAKERWRGSCHSYIATSQSLSSITWSKVISFSFHFKNGASIWVPCVQVAIQGHHVEGSRLLPSCGSAIFSPRLPRVQKKRGESLVADFRSCHTSFYSLVRTQLRAIPNYQEDWEMQFSCEPGKKKQVLTSI